MVDHSSHKSRLERPEALIEPDLEGNVQALSFAVASLDDLLHHTIIPQFRSPHNAITPIHQIPEEIFKLILIATVRPDATNARSYLRTRCSLSLVSKLWYRMIEGTPQIWTVVASNAPQQNIIASVDRSKPFPLAIASDGNFSHAFFDIAVQHADRWATLHYAFPTMYAFSGVGNLQFLLNLRTPILDDVTILSNKYAYGTVLELGIGRPLRRFHLERGVMEWSSPRLRTLRGLTLNEIELPPS